ncbi:hypothetical protein CR513_02013, partial [Mucuna pruriens]
MHLPYPKKIEDLYKMLDDIIEETIQQTTKLQRDVDGRKGRSYIGRPLFERKRFGEIGLYALCHVLLNFRAMNERLVGLHIQRMRDWLRMWFWTRTFRRIIVVRGVYIL